MANDREWLDVNVTTRSPMAQELIAAQRKTYDADKAAKADIVAQLNAEITLEPGKAIVGITYTRWGQLQAIVSAKPEPKAATSSKRKSLDDYHAEQESRGAAH